MTLLVSGSKQVPEHGRLWATWVCSLGSPWIQLDADSAAYSASCVPRGREGFGFVGGEGNQPFEMRKLMRGCSWKNSDVKKRRGMVLIDTSALCSQLVLT